MSKLYIISTNHKIYLNRKGMVVYMPITFAPGGNSDSFTNNKLKFPDDLAEYLKNYNLNGYEIECGRSTVIAAETYKKLPEIAKKNGIYLTLHAPYYISLSGESEEIRLKSVEYIYKSALAAQKLGIQKIVIHSGSCAKMTREEALALAKSTLKNAQDKLDSEGLSEIILCLETMGKINQLGTLSEVLELCLVDERFLPCIDFGHLNARSLGGIKTISDYEAIFDEIQKAIGFRRMNNIHIHFSKIEYTAGGEKKHLTFADNEFGPEFEPFLKTIFKLGIEPSIVCESAGTQAEDCSVMAQYYSRLSK